MINFVSMLIEQVNLEGYTDEDFIEVFVNLFRPWVKSNHGDEVGQHPMSYLVKKYIDENKKTPSRNDKEKNIKQFGSWISKQIINYNK